MHVASIAIQQFRTFVHTEVDFLHAEADFDGLGLGRPKYPNVNVILGTNGAGKTAMLKAIALACLGPAVSDAGIYPYRLVRRTRSAPDLHAAILTASFATHPQDGLRTGLTGETMVQRKGDLETLRWNGDEEAWSPIYSAESDALFFVGYSAMRRVESRDRFDASQRSASSFVRAQRVRGLFDDSFSLVPLNAWLPTLKATNPGRFKQVVGLIDRLLPDGTFSFRGQVEGGEYLFERNGVDVPFPALSDGFRAYLGWIGDLLFHVQATCPSGAKLVDNHGIVLIDEVDLHLHPAWQLVAVPILAKALPNLQFILTTHSPLIVGSLEWQNILALEQAEDGSSRVVRHRVAVHGLDADQVLLSDLFGLESTRAEGGARAKNLAAKAQSGDLKAALSLLREASRGTEKVTKKARVARAVEDEG